MPKIKEISIINAIPPDDNNINTLLQWFALSLGLLSPRDKDKTCFRIFLELLRNSKRHIAISSEDLSIKLGVSRGTIVHHLKKLESAGIVDSESNRYFLTDDSLEKVVKIIQEKVNEILDNIKEVGKEIDETFEKILK